jgi:hypothetical protein
VPSISEGHDESEATINTVAKKGKRGTEIPNIYFFLQVLSKEARENILTSIRKKEAIPSGDYRLRIEDGKLDQSLVLMTCDFRGSAVSNHTQISQ